MKTNLKYYTFIVFCVFLTLKINANTNDVATDYQNQLDEITAQYESQWDILCENADNVAAIIAEAEQKQVLFEEFMERIENVDDPLNDLSEYEELISNPGIAHLVYAKAYGMVYDKDDNRAANLFEFLINENNPNGFTVGNSHYWFARYLSLFKKDMTNALDHYLLVHSLPSCLVFTDASYCRAARIYTEMGKTNTALALYAVQIPHIDYWWKEMWKAKQSCYISFHIWDVTNIVRQIERANLAIKQEPRSTNSYRPFRWRKRLEDHYKFDNLNYAAISNYVMNNYSPYNYEIDCIREALNGEEKAKENPVLEDLLLHAWPLMEDVDVVILTNRVLSNNIYEQKRRTDID